MNGKSTEERWWSENMGYVIGVDIGGTWIRIALASKDGSITKRYTMSTPREGDRYTIANTIAEIIWNRFSGYVQDIEAIGIGTAGPLDLPKGTVIGAPNIPIHVFELGKPLIEEFKKPVIVANDCIAAVWGEKLFGLGRDKSNIVYITLSTGIGGGIIVNDILLLGKMGNAHEVGHMVIDVEGRMECGCGGRGHWEAYAGGANIPRFASNIIRDSELDVEEKGSPIYRAFIEQKLTSEMIYREASKGDKLALKIVNEINKYNIAGFENVINAYDPEIVTVGGAIALKNPQTLVVEPIRRGIENSKGVVTHRPRIELTSLGEDIVLIGAVALAVNPPRNLISMLKYLEQL
ncbi:MAG: ROK family protein [Ignisphaera sp.]